MKQKNETIEKRSRRYGFYNLVIASILLFLLFFVAYKLYLQVYKQNIVNEEVEGLQEEIDRLDQENKNLDELISYLQTDNFKEKEAKDKLNLIKEGEKLVLIKEGGFAEKPSADEQARAADIIVRHENYYYWWHYFFSLK